MFHRFVLSTFVVALALLFLIPAASAIPVPEPSITPAKEINELEARYYPGHPLYNPYVHPAMLHPALIHPAMLHPTLMHPLSGIGARAAARAHAQAMAAYAHPYLHPMAAYGMGGGRGRW